MTHQYKNRQIPAGNPLANVLVIVVGAIVIAVSFVLGLVAFVALAASLLVLAAVVGVRLWWLNRRLRKQQKVRGMSRSAGASDPAVIEGEYRVIRGRDEHDPGQGT